jgi:hypothetical protein
MNDTTTKDFQTHVIMFVVFAVTFLGVFGWSFGFDRPPVQYLPYAFAAWGVGILIRGLLIYGSARDRRS